MTLFKCKFAIANVMKQSFRPKQMSLKSFARGLKVCFTAFAMISGKIIIKKMFAFLKIISDFYQTNVWQNESNQNKDKM